MSTYTVTKRITSRKEYDAANRVIREILEAVEAGDATRREEFELLSLLCRDYSQRSSPWLHAPVKAHETLAFLMKQHGLRQTDLVGTLGDRSAVSSILAGRRRIPVAAAQALKVRFGVDFPALLAREIMEKAVRPRKRRSRADSARSKRG